MDTALAHRLPARAVFRVPDAAAVRIRCIAGSLWLTLDDDLRDYILRAGDSFTAGQRRRGLLYALEPAAFSLTPLAPGEAPCAAVALQPAAD